MIRLWIGLFIAFAIYTCMVYYYCDKSQKTEISPSSNALVGWNIWQNKNCQSCHQIYGLGGYMGPDLTNLASDTTKNDLYISSFIKYGTAKMPNFNLSDSEIVKLVSFLKWVDKSGKNRVSKEKVTWTGNYKLDN